MNLGDSQAGNFQFANKQKGGSEVQRGRGTFPISDLPVAKEDRDTTFISQPQIIKRTKEQESLFFIQKLKKDMETETATHLQQAK